MNRKTREGVMRMLDRLRDELAQGEGARPVFDSVDWEAMDRLSDTELARAVAALAESLPPAKQP